MVRCQLSDMNPHNPGAEFSWVASLYLRRKDETELGAVLLGLSYNSYVIMGLEPVENSRKPLYVVYFVQCYEFLL